MAKLNDKPFCYVLVSAENKIRGAFFFRQPAERMQQNGERIVELFEKVSLEQEESK